MGKSNFLKQLEASEKLFVYPTAEELKQRLINNGVNVSEVVRIQDEYLITVTD